MPEPACRAVWFFEVEVPALVLGSAQRIDVVDAYRADAAGVEVVRRRSGGGAVLLEPGSVLWADVVVPAGDPLFDDDVGRSSHWLGSTWAAALGRLGVAAHVHRGAMQHTDWSRLVCFGGLGPGEVTVGGRKVIGISQRRTRHAARFQCAALGRWDPAAVLALLALDDEDRRTATASLADTAADVGAPLQSLAEAWLGEVARAG